MSVFYDIVAPAVAGAAIVLFAAWALGVVKWG